MTMLILRMCHLNAEQLALCKLLLHLYPGKLTTHSNLKYIYMLNIVINDYIYNVCEVPIIFCQRSV